ncbi:hypothetical protein M427DRAFT_152464 [Gonapodya prolifera JEL478]|uniref:Ferric oxidoreductase domain-containing protein n=1 Tax=Gonapodya prolifera (strain JEL478) TaxID=1344416 RepID=A0A139ARS2_GONPJ|nr:hypothetical protein M427DRAFT_152464 [Gonapodya prolifera JEL478]|eukprot:KXS19446.1 hypothetical protein M427DRAFT_152464 [Gonapodya prolifera JEL478]
MFSFNAAASVDPISVVLIALSVLIFPASWAYIHLLQGHPERCFSDFCNEAYDVYYVPMRQSLAIFYAFIGGSILAVLACRRSGRFSKFFAEMPFRSTTVNVGELIWFFVAMFLVLLAINGICSRASWISHIEYYEGENIPISWGDLFIGALVHSSGDISAFILGLVLLPVSKSSPLGSALGLDYTLTLRMHRWLGWVSFWIFIYHTLVSLLSIALYTTPMAEVFSTFYDGSWGVLNYLYVTGWIAMGAFLILAITSLPWFRRNLYNTFYALHFFGIFGTLVSYLHASMSIYFALPGILLYTIDVILRIIQNFRQHSVASVTHEACGLLVINVRLARPIPILPGQFMRVKLPVGGWWGGREAHPWSLSGASAEEMQFLVAPARSQYGYENWTERVIALTKEQNAESIQVAMQGPFGVPLGVLSKPHDAYVFIVGGSGVAPAIFAIRGILDSPSRSTSPDEHETEAKVAALVTKETDRATVLAHRAQIYLFWSVRAEKSEEMSLIQPWLGAESPVHVHIFDTSRAGADRASIPSAAPDPVAPLVSRHRPGVRNLLYKVVDRCAVGEGVKGTSVGMFVCGPEQLALDAVADAKVVETDGRARFEIEVESFTL